MHQIRGLSDAELKVLEDQSEAAMRTALQQVMDRVAARIGVTQVAAAEMRRVWVGCRYCLNPRHPGPCAKPKADGGGDGRRRSGGGGGGSGGGDGGGTSGEEFDARAAKAAKYDDAEDAAMFDTRDSEIDDALSDYGAGSAVLNTSLRESGGDVGAIESGYNRDTARGLDKGFGESAIRRDAIVQRGVADYRVTFGGREPAAGMEWVDHGYVSTTTRYHAEDRFTGGQGGLQMKMLVPKGTPAIAHDRHLDAGEVLLTRGLKYRVVRDNGLDSDGVRQIDVEVLP